ncbi:unnamed protein product, partial [Trichogramma brassicae]
YIREGNALHTAQRDLSRLRRQMSLKLHCNSWQQQQQCLHIAGRGGARRRSLAPRRACESCLSIQQAPYETKLKKRRNKNTYIRISIVPSCSSSVNGGVLVAVEKNEGDGRSYLQIHRKRYTPSSGQVAAAAAAAVPMVACSVAAAALRHWFSTAAEAAGDWFVRVVVRVYTASPRGLRAREMYRDLGGKIASHTLHRFLYLNSDLKLHKTEIEKIGDTLGGNSPSKEEVNMAGARKKGSC